MLASLWLALWALTPDAEAAAELRMRTAGPVVVFIDGRPARMMANLKIRATDLDPGPHEVRVDGLFGKILYEGEVDLADGMITHLEWADRELRILGTTPIDAIAADEIAAEGEDVAPIAEAEGPAEPPIEEAPDRPLAIPAVEAAADGVEEAPAQAAVGWDAPVPDALEVEDEAIEVVEAPAAPPIAVEAPRERSLSVALREGTTLYVEHGDVRIGLRVEGGALVLEDGEGLRLTLE